MAAQPTPPTDERSRVEQHYDAMRNADSIAAIPDAQLPWPNVRAALLARARAGYDCYAYRPANQPDYVIWDRQPNPAVDARFTPGQWGVMMGYLREFVCEHGLLICDHPRYWIVEADGTLTDRTDGTEGV